MTRPHAQRLSLPITSGGRHRVVVMLAFVLALACSTARAGDSAPAAAAADGTGTTLADGHAVPPAVEPAPPGEPSAPSPDAPPPTTEELPPAQPFLSDLGPGTGPGIPWQAVLVVQLLAYAAADLVPYLGCVLGSWVLSLVVALGAAAGLPFAILLSLLLVPPAALLSGCGAAALLQWLGDRLGVLRGRLAVVGVVSVLLSFLTYALVIFPIIVGMGFFSVAAYSFLSASALLVLPQLNLPSPPWWISAAGYSVSAAGLVAAVVVVAVGAVLAPVVGFMVRPPLVALAYRIAGRSREPGEEQWPPSLVGERADKLPWPFRKKTTQATPPHAPASQPAGKPAAGSASSTPADAMPASSMPESLPASDTPSSAPAANETAPASEPPVEPDSEEAPPP